MQTELDLSKLIESAKAVMQLTDTSTTEEAQTALSDRLDQMGIPSVPKQWILIGWQKATDTAEQQPLGRTEAVFLRSALKRIVEAH